MKLVLTALREGANQIRGSLKPQSLQLDPEVFTDPVTVEGIAEWSGEHAQVRLTIDAPGHFVCDRCACEVHRSITAETRLIVLLEDPVGDDADQDDGETPLLYAGSHGTVVDLTDEIAAALELALPLRLLCQEDCKGLCPVCYTDLNEETCEHAVDGETPIPESPEGREEEAAAGEDDSDFGDVPTESIADKLKRKLEQDNKKKRNT